jgi:hypothetical protein
MPLSRSAAARRGLGPGEESGPRPGLGRADRVTPPPSLKRIRAPRRTGRAHYTPGAAGVWPEQTAGTPIADIAKHALWSETSIQTGPSLKL